MNERIIKFDITCEDGHYVASASGDNYIIVTDGKTLDEVVKNIQEATSLHLEVENDSLGKQLPQTSVVASFEIPIVVEPNPVK